MCSIKKTIVIVDALFSAGDPPRGRRLGSSICMSLGGEQ